VSRYFEGGVKMLEIERLDAMLREAGIPFERADALSSKAFSIRRIQYPQR